MMLLTEDELSDVAAFVEALAGGRREVVRNYDAGTPAGRLCGKERCSP